MDGLERPAGLGRTGGFFPAADTAAWMLSPPTRRLVDQESMIDVLPAVGVAVAIAIWVFVFWSLIGSFLNVVVHRLPLGESVVHGGSRCPRLRVRSPGTTTCR